MFPAWGMDVGTWWTAETPTGSSFPLLDTQRGTPVRGLGASGPRNPAGCSWSFGGILCLSSRWRRRWQFTGSVVMGGEGPQIYSTSLSIREYSGFLAIPPVP